jgi:hypothetical protein
VTDPAFDTLLKALTVSQLQAMESALARMDPKGSHSLESALSKITEHHPTSVKLDNELVAARAYQIHLFDKVEWEAAKVQALQEFASGKLKPKPEPARRQSIPRRRLKTDIAPTPEASPPLPAAVALPEPVTPEPLPDNVVPFPDNFYSKCFHNRNDDNSVW